MAQSLRTELSLDAVLSSGFQQAFKGASDLLSDLRDESRDLKKQLSTLGKEADSIDAIGKSSSDLRDQMKLLSREISHTDRAMEKFSDSKRHFRNAKIGAAALKNEIGGILSTARNAALAIAGIGTAAAVAFSPSEEALAFDSLINEIAYIAPEVDASGIDNLKMDFRSLASESGLAASEVASNFTQLTKTLGFDEAQEAITVAVDFQLATGIGITELAETLQTAKISLGVDTGPELKKYLELLQGLHQKGFDVTNIDQGDLETLRARTGEDVSGENFQREFLITMVAKSIDSFELADHIAAYQEEFARAIIITPEMDNKAILKAQQNAQILAEYGLSAEKGLQGAMDVFRQLNAEQQAQFRERLSPIIGEQTIEIVQRGSAVFGDVQGVVNEIMANSQSLADAAAHTQSAWSATWQQIGNNADMSLGMVQEEFAKAFAPSLLENAQRLFDWIAEHKDEIGNFFEGVHDTISPVIAKIHQTIKNAYPDVKAFALDVWTELKAQFEAVRPAAEFVGGVIWSIAKAIGGFLKEHPRLVATLISGIAAWKLYKITATGVGAVGDVIRGAMSMAGGHIEMMNASILKNTRLSGTMTAASSGIKSVFSGIGTAALTSIPSISAMGASLWAAIAPILPVALPIIGIVAGIGAAAFIIYKNWEPIKSFFVDNWETIRTALLIVFPPLGLLISFAKIIKDNWQPLKEFFAEVFRYVKNIIRNAFEAIQFVALGAYWVIKNLWSGMTDFFAGIWSGVTDFFMNSPLAPIFEWMVDGVKKVVSPLTGFFSNFWENVSSLAGDAIEWITSKFKFMNDVLDKAFGWLRKKNNEMREDLGIKTEMKVDAPDAFNTEQREFIKEQYDVDLNKLPRELAEELGRNLITLENQSQMIRSPEQAEAVDVLKQDYLKDLTKALEGTDLDRKERRALENVADALKEQLRIKPDKPESFDDYMKQYQQEQQEQYQPYQNQEQQTHKPASDQVSFDDYMKQYQEQQEQYKPYQNQEQQTHKPASDQVSFDDYMKQYQEQQEQYKPYQNQEQQTHKPASDQVSFDDYMKQYQEQQEQYKPYQNQEQPQQMQFTQPQEFIQQNVQEGVSSMPQPLVNLAQPAIDVSTPQIASPIVDVPTPQAVMESASSYPTPVVDPINTIIEANTAQTVDSSPIVNFEQPSNFKDFQLDPSAVNFNTTELENIGLGNLLENTKQTMLLQDPSEFIKENVIQTPDIPVLESPEMPVLESPEINAPLADLSLPEMPALEMPAVPEIHTPEVDLSTPEVELQDYTVPSVPPVSVTETNTSESTSEKQVVVERLEVPLNFTIHTENLTSIDESEFKERVRKAIDDAMETLYQQ